MKKAILSVIAALALASAQAVTLHMATPYPDREFHTRNIKAFIEEVQKATDGKIQITLHSGASLYKAPEIFRAVRSNQIALGELLISSLGNDDPLFKIDTLPFLATHYPEVKKLWAVSRSDIAKKLEEKGVVLLFATPWPGQNFYTEEPIDSPDDLKGRKIRAYNAQTAEIIAALGALPTTIEASAIAQAFSTNQIDAMITSTSTGVSAQAWDFVRYLTTVNAWYPKNMVFINKKHWRRLDEDTRTQILAAARKAEARGFQMSQAVDAENLKTLADHGVVISRPSPALKTKLSAVGKEMARRWAKETGSAGQNILAAYRGE